jgi:hypothetical protein
MRLMRSDALHESDTDSGVVNFERKNKKGAQL